MKKETAIAIGAAIVAVPALAQPGARDEEHGRSRKIRANDKDEIRRLWNRCKVGQNADPATRRFSAVMQPCSGEGMTEERLDRVMSEYPEARVLEKNRQIRALAFLRPQHVSQKPGGKKYARVDGLVMDMSAVNSVYDTYNWFAEVVVKELEAQSFDGLWLMIEHEVTELPGFESSLEDLGIRVKEGGPHGWMLFVDFDKRNDGAIAEKAKKAAKRRGLAG